MLQAILWDIDTGADIADLTEFSTIVHSPRLSKQRAATVTLAGDTPAIQGVFGDGYPVLQEGRRSIRVLRDGSLVGNELLWNIAPSGDENRTQIILTGYDPTVMLPARYVRDSDGSITKFDFAIPITGGDLLQQAIDNSVAEVGALPIDTASGTISTTLDLSTHLTVAPLKISELYKLLVDTGAVDVVMAPDDSTPGNLAILNVYDHFGSDLSGTVHFDYALGAYNVARARREFDMAALCNRLYYYIGPRISEQRWQANITGTETGPTIDAPNAEDLSAYETLQLASRDKYLWTYEDSRFYDQNDARVLGTLRMLHQLWISEVVLRTNARQLLYLTPTAGVDQPFKPYDDYNLGDVVAGNLADILGPAATRLTQRIWGFDLTQEPNGPERVSELLVSPEAT